MKVADIEEKLDLLIKTYMDDRQRFQVLPFNSQVSKHSLSHQPPIQGQYDPINNWQNCNAKLSDKSKATIDTSKSSASYSSKEVDEFTKVSICLQIIMKDSYSSKFTILKPLTR